MHILHLLHMPLFHLRGLLRMTLLHLLLALLAEVPLLRLQQSMLLVLAIDQGSLLLLLMLLSPLLRRRLCLMKFRWRSVCLMWPPPFCLRLVKRQRRLVSRNAAGMIQLSLGCSIGSSGFSCRNDVRPSELGGSCGGGNRGLAVVQLRA